MQDKHRPEFENWWVKYDLDSTRSTKKIARAAWDAAWHLSGRIARKEGRKQKSLCEAKYKRLMRLAAATGRVYDYPDEMTLEKIDELEARIVSIKNL